MKNEKRKIAQTVLWRQGYLKAKEIFGLDTRSLSLLRVCLAITTLYDLYDRARDLSAHYTDAGVMSRSTVLSHLWSDYWFSFYLMSGNFYYVSALFIIHTIIGVFLLVGYRTKLMLVLTWLFTVSIQTRNIIIGHSGDTLHVLLLFWAFFLPMSDHFSIDSMNNPELEKKRRTNNNPQPYQANNVASFAFMIQILCMYFCAHNLKVGAAWREDFTAAYLALGLDFFRRPFGDVLLMFPTVLKISTWGVLWWQGVGPYLYFSPVFTGPLRTFVVFGFSCMHWGFGIAMRLGQFTFITASGVTGLTPGWAWDHLFNFLRTKRRSAFKFYFKSGCKGTQTIPVLTLRISDNEDPCNCSGGLCGHGKDESIWMACQDYRGVHLYNFEALKELLVVSPLLWPLSYIKFEKLSNFRVFRYLGSMIRNSIHDHENNSNNFSSVSSTSSYGKKTTFYEEPIELQVVKLTYEVMRVIVKNAWCLLCLYIIISRNAQTLGTTYKILQTPGDLYPLMNLFHLDQNWAMFTPQPPNSWWWYNIEAELANNTKVELFSEGALFTHIPNIPHTFDKPKDGRFYLGFKNHRWFKFFENGYNNHPSYDTLRLEFGRWVCREYNAVHRGDQRLWKYSVHLMNEMDNYQHDGTRTFTGKQTLWSHACY